MKRTGVLLSSLLLVGLIGCGDDNDLDPSIRDAASSGADADGGTGGGGAGDASTGDGGTGDASTGDGGTVDAGPADECDPLGQDCPVEGESCVISPTGGVHATCARLVSAHALGEVCTGQDCAEGLACVNSGDTAYCERICNYATISECPGDDVECRGKFSGSDWGYCVALPALCNWVDNTPCTDGQACQPMQSRETEKIEMRCRTAGTAQPGDGCAGLINCVAGSACVVDSEGTRCREYCTPDGACSDSAETCSTSTVAAGVRVCH